jgi:hypothetical protein
MLTDTELKELYEATLENTPKYTFKDQCKTIKVLSVFERNPCYFVGAFYDDDNKIKQFEFWCPRSNYDFNNVIEVGDILETDLDDFMQDNDCICVKEMKIKK